MKPARRRRLTTLGKRVKSPTRIWPAWRTMAQNAFLRKRHVPSSVFAMNTFRDSENYHSIHAYMISPKSSTHEGGDLEPWRRACGCLKTSEKLRRILNSFPKPPPPTPKGSSLIKPQHESTVRECMPHCMHVQTGTVPVPRAPSTAPLLSPKPDIESIKEEHYMEYKKDVEPQSRMWWLLVELASLIRLSVTATALALYYIIYCYMQLVYFTLRSAVYFHQADGPMKITIAVVTLTSVVVGSNLILRLERILGYQPVSSLKT